MDGALLRIEFIRSRRCVKNRATESLAAMTVARRPLDGGWYRSPRSAAFLPDFDETGSLSGDFSGEMAVSDTVQERFGEESLGEKVREDESLGLECPRGGDRHRQRDRSRGQEDDKQRRGPQGVRRSTQTQNRSTQDEEQPREQQRRDRNLETERAETEVIGRGGEGVIAIDQPFVRCTGGNDRRSADGPPRPELALQDGGHQASEEDVGKPQRILLDVLQHCCAKNALALGSAEEPLADKKLRALVEPEVAFRAVEVAKPFPEGDPNVVGLGRCLEAILHGRSGDQMVRIGPSYRMWCQKRGTDQDRSDPGLPQREQVDRVQSNAVHVKLDRSPSGQDSAQREDEAHDQERRNHQGPTASQNTRRKEAAGEKGTTEDAPEGTLRKGPQGIGRHRNDEQKRGQIETSGRIVERKSVGGVGRKCEQHPERSRGEPVAGGGQLPAHPDKDHAEGERRQP